MEDKLLVWRLQRGSEAALRRIYEKYRSDLLRIASGLLVETGEAEDVVHDVFASFVESCRGFELTGSLQGYLTTCVANRARNVNRTRARRAATELKGTHERGADPRRPDEWIVHNDEYQRVHEAMCKLPYEQREVVALRAQGAMKFREIAHLQGTSVKTTLSRYRYGMEKLGTLLQEGA